MLKGKISQPIIYSDFEKRFFRYTVSCFIKKANIIYQLYELYKKYANFQNI